MSSAITVSSDTFSAVVLPDRGLDIGQLTFEGFRLDWESPLGSSDVFPGGLVTTCGLHNVGPAGEGYALHGSFSQTPADGVSRSEINDDLGDATVISGVIGDGDLTCTRRITIRPLAGSIVIEDVVSNQTDGPIQAPLLYHVNWGAQFLDRSLVVDVRDADAVARDPGSGVGDGDWRRPMSVDSRHEVVVEHIANSGIPVSRAMLTNSSLKVRATVAWSGLDRLHQWIDLAANRRVVAIEPANCSVLGRAEDRRLQRAPFLAARENRTTTLTITLEKL